MIAWIGARLDELRVGMMFLTRLPMGTVQRTVPLSATAWAWPLAGLVVAAVMALTSLALQALGLSAPVAIGCALVAGVLASGGLHEDGLADLADGIGGGTDAARRLEIMKDSRIGSYGAIALILLFLLRFLGFQELSATALWLSLILIEVSSRMALPLWSLTFPSARQNGLAKGAGTGLTASRAAIGLALGLTICCAVTAPLTALGAISACLAAQFLTVLYARPKLGGVTGDVLGAAQVLGALTALLALGAL